VQVWDVNYDGRMDVLVGVSGGEILYYGASRSGSGEFTEITGAGLNPFAVVQLGDAIGSPGGNTLTVIGLGLGSGLGLAHWEATL